MSEMDAPVTDHVSSEKRKQTAAPRSEVPFARAHMGQPIQDGGPKHQVGVHTDFASAENTPAQVGQLRAEQNDCRIDFGKIREVCEKNKMVHDIDFDPMTLRAHRRTEWPRQAFASADTSLAYIYTTVRDSGIPNAMESRLELPTKLNLEAWSRYLAGRDDQLLDFIRFGFPMGYMGPASNTMNIANHPSAVQFPTHVDAFVAKEIALGGLIGPLTRPPFQGWAHVSPIMTRPKSSPDDRRVITDLTYPEDSSVNAYIKKNVVMGLSMSHSLPSIDAVVERLQQAGPTAHLFTLDVSRAYKNFKSCPLDWPLLAIRWADKYYLDVTMPFGARASSGHMQRVADAIVHILAKKGIVAHMYLDDLVVVAESYEAARNQYNIARDLLVELGLPEATDKTQPPATCVTWLGIVINAAEHTLSVPKDKLDCALEMVNMYIKRRSISRKQLQSLIGRLLHIAKCIRPARLFVSRLLEALRGAPRFYININSDMKNDLIWFRDFAAHWNGVSVFPDREPTNEIVVDACLTAIGGATDDRAYSASVAHADDPLVNISEVEAINIAVALQTFMGPEDKGRCVVVYCDNMSAVQVMQSGKGKNLVMLEAARMAWMVQAMFQLTIIYRHIPGDLNTLADTLSRAPNSQLKARQADHMVSELGLKWVAPSLHPVDIVSNILHSRSTAEAARDGGGGQTGACEGTRYKRQQEGGGQGIPDLLPHVQLGPPRPPAPSDMHLRGTAQRQRVGPTHGAQSSGPHKVVPLFGGGGPRCESYASDTRDRGNSTSQGLSTERQRPSPTARLGGCDSSHPGDKRADAGESSHINYIQRSAQAIGGSTANSQCVRPPETPHKGRRDDEAGQNDSGGKGCQKYAALSPKKIGGHLPSHQQRHLPGAVGTAGHQGLPSRSTKSTHVCV